MFERELEQEEKTLAAERGRSPSEAASVFGGAAEPTAEAPAVDRPQVVLPTAEANPPIPAASGPEPSSSAPLQEAEAAELADDFLDEESFPEEPFEEPLRKPRLVGNGRARGRRLVKPAESPQPPMTPEQRLLILDTWQRSGLPAGDFAPLVGVSKHTLYAWKARFDEQGPAGLMDLQRGGPKGSRMPELTKRTILMLKQSNPAWGCQRISDMLLRGPALPASATAVARVLHEAGYQMEEVTTRPHPDKVRQFERAAPNQLWQTDLFTFVLKRQNRRVYLVAFMDDNSRFITGYGLHASQSTAMVLEVVRAAIVAYGTPKEMLTDNGSQYVTWRGTSVFHREMDKRGIKHIVAKPQRPQTLGKIERFWGTLWRECIETSVFLDLEDARRRIGHFIDYYNFQRPHQGIEGLVPADRFFGAASEVLQTLRNRVAANALELARNGVPKAPFYVTGRIGDRAFSVHAEGERMILKREGQSRQEVDLTAPDAAQLPLVSAVGERSPSEMPLPVCPDGSPRGPSGAPLSSEEDVPGASPLDAGLRRMDQAIPGLQPESQANKEGCHDEQP
jgi:transposase InsO family protein